MTITIESQSLKHPTLSLTLTVDPYGLALIGSVNGTNNCKAHRNMPAYTRVSYWIRALVSEDYICNADNDRYFRDAIFHTEKK